MWSEVLNYINPAEEIEKSIKTKKTDSTISKEEKDIQESK